MELASGLGLNRKNLLVRFQNQPNTRAAPIHVNPRVLPGSARPVGSNVQFCITGFTIHRRIQICYCESQNVDIGTSLFDFDVLAALMIKMNWDTRPTTSQKWASTEHQQLLLVYFG